MDTEKFNILLSVKLRPHGKTPPVITCVEPNAISHTLILDYEKTLDFNLNVDTGSHIFAINFNSKLPDNIDTAVEIVSVSFEGIELDRFKWNSRYYPDYPEPWASQQTEPLPEFQEAATYLGWNGRWELYFEAPIFTWIHKLESLGWIYGVDPETGLLKISQN